MELPSTCHYVHIIGSLWDYEGEGCYYPGSNCLVNNDQCVSVFKDTGCRGGDKQYQCAQVYYQKKQTTILEQQTPPQVGTSLKQENVELKLQLQNIQ